jgi:hypothetical protein
MNILSHQNELKSNENISKFIIPKGLLIFKNNNNFPRKKILFYVSCQKCNERVFHLLTTWPDLKGNGKIIIKKRRNIPHPLKLVMDEKM